MLISCPASPASSGIAQYIKERSSRLIQDEFQLFVIPSALAGGCLIALAVGMLSPMFRDLSHAINPVAVRIRAIW